MVMCRQPAMRAPFRGWLSLMFIADGDEAGHFSFCNGDFLVAIISKGNIGDLKISKLGHSGSFTLSALPNGTDAQLLRRACSALGFTTRYKGGLALKSARGI